MEPPVYQRKYEALNRSLKRLEEFYSGRIDTIDSFSGPKDYIFSYFDCTYALKESLKFLPDLEVEKFVASSSVIALGIDISNKNKHGQLGKPKTMYVIGIVNAHVHIFDPQGKDRTELTIEIDGDKKDCLQLAKENFDHWRDYLLHHSLINR